MPIETSIKRLKHKKKELDAKIKGEKHINQKNELPQLLSHFGRNHLISYSIVKNKYYGVRIELDDS